MDLLIEHWLYNPDAHPESRFVQKVSSAAEGLEWIQERGDSFQRWLVVARAAKPVPSKDRAVKGRPNFLERYGQAEYKHGRNFIKRA